MYEREIKHFLKSVKKKNETINPVETDGFKTLKIALGIIKSSKTNRVVKL